jgi:hypothetical protein
MIQRAYELRYRIEPLWLRAQGMTHARLCRILDARGIEGLLCLGSPDADEIFPAEFDHYAIVAQGVSIRTNLHRVATHATADMTRTLDAIYRLGYRRPGLVLGDKMATRSADAYLGAYLGWCHQKFGKPLPTTLLRLVQVDEAAVLRWLKQQKPDVVVVVLSREDLLKFGSVLQRNGLRWPQDFGVAAICQFLEGTEFAGMEANQRLLGAWSVELLTDRILNHDLGIPQHPRLLMVESHWVSGRSLRLSLA